MARYFDIHPANPQQRAIVQVADVVRAGGVIASWAIWTGSRGSVRSAALMTGTTSRWCAMISLSSASSCTSPNRCSRAIKAATPGSYTFILPATKEVPRRLQHPGKKTVGVRIPRHVVTQALLAELGEPLVSSTLLLPGQDEPMTRGWEIDDHLGHAVDAVIDSGDCGTEPTTVIDFSQDKPEILRRGAGDTSGFE
jgi:tRNA threonylcarbamoyl adenosine modification protein (Sua5/YciO/YrdC/YwlC family)